MKFLILLISFVVVGCKAIPLQIPAYKNSTFESRSKFDDWTVQIDKGNFEGKSKPILISKIISSNGRNIGTIRVGYFVNPDYALVSLFISGLDGTWPECDYEFTRYIIDSSESKFFPKSGHACPTLIMNKKFASKLSGGKSLKLEASGVMGAVSLNGFQQAWGYASKQVNQNQ